MASSRQESESIDKRNAAVMELEARYRQALATIEMFVAWEEGRTKSSPAQDFNDAIKEARAVIQKSKTRRR